MFLIADGRSPWATGVSDQKRAPPGWLLVFFVTTPTLLLAHRFTLQLEPVCCMDQPVEDAVGHRWIADLRMPLCHWQLAGEQRCPGQVAFVTDLQKRPPFGVGQWRHRPVIDDQDIYLSQRPKL